jgi:hypothetical protein
MSLVLGRMTKTRLLSISLHFHIYSIRYPDPAQGLHMCIRVMFLSRRQRCNEIDTGCSLFSQLRVATYDEPSNEI